MKIALSISILSICLLIVTDLPVYFYRTHKYAYSFYSITICLFASKWIAEAKT